MNALSLSGSRPVPHRVRFLAGLFFLAALASWLPAAIDLRDGGAAEHQMTPAAPQLNVPFTFDFVVENAGNTEAVGAQAVFYLSIDQVLGNAGDTLLARVNLPTISSKAPAKISTNLTITAPGGPWYLIWVLEHRDEANARDNTVIYANQLTIAAPPTGFDLADAGGAQHGLTPASRSPGEVFTVAATVENRGPAASPAFTVNYYLSANATYENTDVLLGTVNGAAMNAPSGQLFRTTSVGTSLTVPAGQAPGTYRIIYLIKSEADTNQANNTVLLGPSLTVTTPPRNGFDLMDAGAALRSISPTSVQSGQNITVQASVRNFGPDASPAFSVEYRLSTNDTFGDGDDVILGTQPGAAMPAPPLDLTNPPTTPVGRTLTIPAGQTPGAYRLLLRINAPADTN